MTRKSVSDRYNRRTFIKASAATGAALATGSIFAPAVRAAKTIKLGYVSPQTGPLAAFAEANNFIISNFQNAEGMRHHHRRSTAAGLHDFLESSPLAGIEAEDRLGR
jgi:TAT (twin-arginine translocation) pathway signal sequence